MFQINDWLSLGSPYLYLARDSRTGFVFAYEERPTLSDTGTWKSPSKMKFLGRCEKNRFIEVTS